MLPEDTHIVQLLMQRGQGCKHPFDVVISKVPSLGLELMMGDHMKDR